MHPLRAISSVGSEHLVYTEGVGGSNPSLPTSIRIPMNENSSGFFISQRFSARAQNLWEIKNPTMRFSALGFYPPPADRFAVEVNQGSRSNPPLVNDIMLQCYNDFEISLGFSTLGFYPPTADRFAAEVNQGSQTNPSLPTKLNRNYFIGSYF